MDAAQEGPNVGEVASTMEEDTGSPMQQSPDQSNMYDNYRFSDTSFSEEMNIDIKQDKANKQDLEELNTENVEGLFYGFSSTNKVETEESEIDDEFSKDSIENLKNEEQMNGIANEADGFEEFNYNAQSYQTGDLDELCNKKIISSSLQKECTINLEQPTGSEGSATYSSAYNNEISESGMIEQEEVTSTSSPTFKITDNKSATTVSYHNTCHTFTDKECNSQIIDNANTVPANEKDSDDETGETSLAKYSDYEDNDELDLTKSDEDSRKDDYSEIEADIIVCQKMLEQSQQEIDYNVSSSTNILDDKISAEESDQLKCTTSNENQCKSTVGELPQDDEDEEKTSASSLEEVSDGEIDESERSGVEEVSLDEEESECSEESVEESIVDDSTGKIQSGIEEVSDEEEVDEGGEKQNNHKVEILEKRSASGMEEVSEEEGELEDESGVEEVSEEESDDNKVDKSISNKENDSHRRNIESENGVENVSSEEDEHGHDFEDSISGKQDKGELSVDKHDKKDIKKIHTFSDTKVDAEAIVREILHNLIDKIKYSNSEHKSRKKCTKDKKDRRESVKLKNKSCPAKDIRDINERLKAQASYGDDIELDYDDIHDDAKDRQGSESEGEIVSGSESSDGEIEDEEDCEEGEIREPGQKPFVKPTCRFFMRGHCTWGINCRFLHPGVNDKGCYQLIDRPGFNNKPPVIVEDKWEVEQHSPSPEPPPPPAPEPKEETAWERGLRQAKELRKKALERRELEPNFEHKKMNLSIEDNPEYDKENTVEKVIKDKSPIKKQTYYDKYESLSDDEYYDQTPIRLHQKQQLEQAWLPGHYENFEVRWTHDRYMPLPLPPPRFTPDGRFPPYHPDEAMGGQERFPRRPSPRQFSPSPPLRRHPGDDDMRYARQPPVRDPKIMYPEKFRERPMSPSPQKFRPQSPSKQKADEWHDPWRRSNVNKSKSPKKRSQSRGRRRSRRSYSYSTSYSSSTYSSRSRSSSSSLSSRSHSSRSSSLSNRSISPPAITLVRALQKQRPVLPAGNQQPLPPRPARVPEKPRPSDPHRSAVAAAPVRPGRSPPVKPPGAVPPPSPSKAPKGARRGPINAGSGRGPINAGPGRGPTNAGPIGQPVPDVIRKPQKPASPVSQPVERKFKMEVKTRDRLLPQSALSKEVPKPRPRGRKASSSTSRSRSQSRLRSSSSSSSHTSYSSRSSRSYSRSSSSSSDGSADSDHLYRNIGSRENPRQALPPPLPRGKPTEKIRHAHQADVRAPGPPSRMVTKPIIGETSRPVSAIQAQIIKDPLKVTGQKSNIKLTLIKPNDKPPAVPPQEPHIRKRPAEPTNEGPPPKRPSVVNNPIKIDKPVKKVEKPPLLSPTKVQPRAAVPIPARSVVGAPVVPAVTVKKKSTVSRREELLKQLKAVEDAIAKKKKKIE